MSAMITKYTYLVFMLGNPLISDLFGDVVDTLRHGILIIMFQLSQQSLFSDKTLQELCSRSFHDIILAQ